MSVKSIPYKRKNNRKINIAIDGPGGAGKSTLAKQIAAALFIHYVDTGAIYRTVGYAVRQAGLCPDSEAEVKPLLDRIRVELRFEGGEQRMYLNGESLGDKIREHEISDYASRVSALPAVRAFLLGLQRDVARRYSTVMDGRDIGTVILPRADVKIFLSAGVENRARRRFEELKAKGQECTYETVLADMQERDHRDTHRDIAPLKPAEDAVLLDNSALDIPQTLDAALKIVFAKRPDVRNA